MFRLASLVVLLALTGQQSKAPDWTAIDAETLAHFQALVRFDTSDPPGREREAVDYLKKVLEAEGIPTEEFTNEAHRPNLVARLKGSGAKRPLLLMAHTDTVNVYPERWTFPPFGATIDGGYVYGRGTVDDKDNVATSLMIMLMLKRLNVPLDRDVIFLAESGEEGSTQVGIQFMADMHFESIDAEYCIAEGGRVTRTGGVARYAQVQTLEKRPFGIELVARGPAGHGSVPLESSAVTHLAQAVAAVTKWQPEIRLNETTSAFFKRLAVISEPAAAERYRAVADPTKVAAADEYFRRFEPTMAAILRSTVSPNIVAGGNRINVIPSEAIATLDTRILPDEDITAFVEQVRRVVNDPAVEVRLAKRNERPGGVEARIDSDVFKAIETAVKTHYNAPTLPSMSTGATDMAYLRAKGIQCYGIGPALDTEDGPKGFGAHSDQERILITELHRFMRMYWDVVVAVAGRQPSAKGSVEQTLSEARAYLEQYRSDMSFILADEDTTQRITRQTPIVQGAPTDRRTKAEVYFKYVDVDNTWMAIREFVQVDGRTVEKQPDLKAALQSQGLVQVAQTFKTFNSKFNVGRIYRNFNEPTLALGVLELDRGPQFMFTHKGTRRSNGLTLTTLAYREQPGPDAFVYNLDMQPAAVSGEIVIEQGTGRIHKTLLEIQMTSVKAVLTTEYAPAASVNLLVPTVFRELYESGVDHSGSGVLTFANAYESIFCASRYTNFRQFKTMSRIK